MYSKIASQMPFYSICDDELETVLTTCKQRLLSLLHDEGLQEFINNNSIYNDSIQWKPCRYADEDMFCDMSVECGTDTLKIFSMNIRSLPKHKGEFPIKYITLQPFDFPSESYKYYYFP